VTQSTLTIALAGNPNVGKSTIFNTLTGARQHVGNWPGKTVEKKEGVARIGGCDVTIVDLPGIYSLNAYSLEEIITRDFIVNERPGLVVTVADAANLERTLYLVVQVIELEVPVVIVLNMGDVAHKRGIQIDTAVISARLGGVPVIETVGTHNNRDDGIGHLKRAILDLTARPHSAQHRPVAYGDLLEGEIAGLRSQIETDPVLSQQFKPRWLAIKLLENDEDLRARLDGAGYQTLLDATDQAMDRIFAQADEDAETLITDRRYHFIGEVLRGAVIRAATGSETRSDRFDKIVTHPVWGVPIFLLLMWIVFQLTANVSGPFLDWIDYLISGPITRWALALIGAVGLENSWVEALIVDGAIAGVGGVLVFVPVLIFLYMAVAVLEDSGYMARSALVMDRAMRVIGLQGKSFLPLMVGFGCNVPAIYATRTLDDEENRRQTAFLITFMSCGARLPVYVVFGTAFFGDRSGNLIFAMYLLGIVVALVTGLAMKYFVYRNKPSQPFVLELPPYRAPNFRNVFAQVGQRTAAFLRNAATLILACSIVIWFLLAIPTGRGKGGFDDVRTEDSVFGSLSRVIAPVFSPAGFGSWESTGSLITGFVAKEAVVGTMNQIYVEEANGTAIEKDPETDDEHVDTSLLDDAEEIVTTFGEASIWTVQETLNILPHTINLMPGADVPQADWLDSAEAEDTTGLQHALMVAFTDTAGSPARGKLAAVAFNVFVLLYVPCMASMAAMRHEFGVRWMAYQLLYTLILAWTMAVIVYQGGLWFGWG
jgi:ferrous iron transport protein B